MLQPQEPVPMFLAASLAALDGQYVLILVGAVGVMYRNWRADDKERREENKNAFEAVTGALSVIKEENHSAHIDAVKEELASLRHEFLQRFDSIDRRLSAQPQSLQRIVPTVPEDEPRATG